MDGCAALSYHPTMKSPLHLLRRLVARLSERRRRARFAASIRHLHGPRCLDLGEDDVLAIVLVRNGSYYLDAFFDHYRSLGIRHFAFIDNGSSDDTLDRLMARSDCVVDQCTLPLARYEDLIRAYPAQTYGRDRWCLYVDMDEILDFEGAATHGIRALTSYMQAQGHTAMVAQMLEMFPKAPLAEVARLPYDRVLRDFVYFDISSVARYDYHSPEIPFSALLRDNRLSSDAVQFRFGGVRGKVFGENCCLTKHPLIFNGPGVTPAPHPHLSMGVTVSDVTPVIQHYKFANEQLARDAASLTSGDLAHGEDAARAQVLSRRPDVSLFSLDARRWNRVELLARAGFTVTSQAYADHLAGLSS
ncbi:hypothetical protein FIU94_16770 [Sulfitobacter sp. THAF37]|uniref:glycosyltransferase family 2 protein n=1 Tax=Sulfitobacter sp. THAF37 TaxID=2587855 RepID=UPI0012A9F0CC|nr:glycosyltransferase family 2 protein [Sulfitobacter sp. THAF37]QFT60484.1 hypothetical protein FIU94_16770 [Sulfitobacter sp. THAF37]